MPRSDSPAPARFLEKLRGQLRGRFAGLGIMLVLTLLLIVLQSMKDLANRIPLLPPGVLASLFGRHMLIHAAMLLPPLPFVVLICNMAPAAYPRRVAWMAGAALLWFAGWQFSPLMRPFVDLPWRLRIITMIVLLVLAFEFRRRSLESAGALMQVRIADFALQTELDRAHLQLLRAQVEPHFLFNTLANVRQLSRVDRAATAGMLDDLIGYFSSSLAHQGATTTTLGEEARLIESYLRIHRIRMGERLAYELDVPPELASSPVPSMMLLTLIENAIKHGLTPLAEGGFIRLRAARSDDTLVLEVADTGRGMNAQEGHGTGLANIRARLEMTYGPTASLSLARGEPRGVVARIRLPLENAA
jgi:signal transduction histidine kinase